MARLAAARRRRRPGGPPDHVRARRRAAARRARARLAAGLRGLGAGARRQRRLDAAPARRVRRGASTPLLPGARARAAADAHAWSLLRKLLEWLEDELAAARRGHLGGARAAAALHPLEGDGVGRLRPRRADRTRSSGSTGPVERWRRAPRRDPRARSASARSTPSAARSRSRTASTRSTRASLLMPLVGFLAGDDPRVRRDRRRDRARADRRRPRRSATDRDDGDVDGLPAGRGRRSCRARSGSPTCSRCWGAHDEARELFERLLDLRNDVGLLSEEYDPARAAPARQLPAGVHAPRARQQRARPRPRPRRPRGAAGARRDLATGPGDVESALEPVGEGSSADPERPTRGDRGRGSDGGAAVGGEAGEPTSEGRCGRRGRRPARGGRRPRRWRRRRCAAGRSARSGDGWVCRTWSCSL